MRPLHALISFSPELLGFNRACVSQSAELEGRYASAEQRLSDNAEEVVFFGGAERERGLLTEMLRALTRQGYRSVSTLFAVGVLDQYLAKYLASVAGYITLSVPVIFNLDSIKGKSTADLTAAYSRNSRCLHIMSTFSTSYVTVLICLYRGWCAQVPA